MAIPNERQEVMDMPAAYAHYCFGKEVYKPTIGDKTREIEIEDIVRTNKIMYSSSIISMIIFTAIYYLVVTL